MSIFEYTFTSAHAFYYGNRFLRFKIITVNNKTNFITIEYHGNISENAINNSIHKNCNEYNQIISDECIIILNLIKTEWNGWVKIKNLEEFPCWGNKFIKFIKILNNTIIEKNNNINKLNNNIVEQNNNINKLIVTILKKNYNINKIILDKDKIILDKNDNIKKLIVTILKKNYNINKLNNIILKFNNKNKQLKNKIIKINNINKFLNNFIFLIIIIIMMYYKFLNYFLFFIIIAFIIFI
jgi:hypothetical protein